MAEVTGLRNNALPYPVYGLPWGVVFPMLDADGDLVTGATTPDAEVSKNGDTFADCTNESTEIATNSGVYYLLLTGTEMTADVVSVIAKSATAGMKTTVLTFYPRKLVTIRTGTSASGGVATSTIVLDGSASAVDDFYNGMIVAAVIDSNTEVRTITDYTGSNQTATVTPDWNTAPDNNDTFTVYLPDGVQIQQSNVSHWNSLATVELPLVPTTAGRKLDVSAGGEAGVDWANVGGQSTSVNLSATTINLANTATTVTNQLTAAQIATGVWQDTTAGDFTVASSIGKSLYTSGVVPGGSGGLLISGSNSGTTTLGALTVSGATTLAALSCTTLTASGAVAFQSTFAVTTSTSLGALSCTTLTASGAVAFQSTFAVTTSTSLAALSCTTLTASGAVAFQSTFAVTTSTSLAALSATTITASGTTSLAAVTTSGTVTFNAFTVTNALTAGTNAVPWNASWDAEVQSEVQDAIEVNHLDHILAVAAAGTEAVNSSYWSRLVSKSATPAYSSFDNTTDSLEALRDRGDAAWTTATGFSTLDAAGVRTAVGLASANLDTQLDALPTAAENAAAVLTTQMTESYNADGTAPTLAQASFVTLQRLTEFSISNTTVTVKKLDGTTTAYTLTLDSATTPSSSTRAT